MSAVELRELAERPRLPDPADARRVLAEHGILVRELADAVGVHCVTASKWLSGRQRPTGPPARLYAETIALLANDEGPAGETEPSSKSGRQARDAVPV